MQLHVDIDICSLQNFPLQNGKLPGKFPGKRGLGLGYSDGDTYCAKVLFLNWSPADK